MTSKTGTDTKPTKPGQISSVSASKINFGIGYTASIYDDLIKTYTASIASPEAIYAQDPHAFGPGGSYTVTYQSEADQDIKASTNATFDGLECNEDFIDADKWRSVDDPKRSIYRAGSTYTYKNTVAREDGGQWTDRASSGWLYDCRLVFMDTLRSGTIFLDHYSGSRAVRNADALVALRMLAYSLFGCRAPADPNDAGLVMVNPCWLREDLYSHFSEGRKMTATEVGLMNYANNYAGKSHSGK